MTDLIDEIFVNETMDFFKKIVEAKSNGHQIDKDWYSKHFLNEILSKNDIAWNSGTNLKTVSNRRGSTNKWIVLDEAHKQFKQFSNLVDSYSNDELNLSLRISNGQKPVVLDFNESFVAINAIAVRRAGIRGGAWSSLGKQVEGPLMTVLCMLHNLDTNRYRRQSKNNDPLREVDFYLVKPDGSESKCEVKLMGKGNPESTDAVVARESKVFVASTLSQTNKQQLDNLDVLWIELQRRNGFTKFGEVLTKLNIPHTNLDKNADHTNRIEKTILAFQHDHESNA